MLEEIDIPQILAVSEDQHYFYVTGMTENPMQFRLNDGENVEYSKKTAIFVSNPPALWYTVQNGRKEKGENTMTKRIVIEGMMCPRCTGRVEKALNAVEGVEAKVDLKGADVTITGDVADQTLIDTITAAGYTFVRFE